MTAPAHPRELKALKHLDVALEEEGTLLRIALARPRANILDRDMVREMLDVLEAMAGDPRVRAVLFEHEGTDFSFGASVEEHLPDDVEAMLTDFHSLFRSLMNTSLPLLAAVRGRALGAGCELATFCHRVFASPDLQLGQPEIKLGVFAPVASVVLPQRTSQAVADDLLISGRAMGAHEALTTGLIDELADDPSSAARAWFREHIAPKSGASLRFAVRSSRNHLHDRLRSELDDMERLYLDELMDTNDAVEGLTAFLEKRQPEWSDR